MVENRRHHGLRLIDQLDQVHVRGIDHALAYQRLPEPGDCAAPERLAYQDDRYFADLAGLHQGQRFHQYVESAEAAGHHDIGAGEFYEHYLAREKMPEGLADVLERINALLVRQLDVEPDAGR